MRAYVAGGGATAALVAAAVVAFLSVAAFVGFNGLPFGADDAPDATLNLAAGAPEAAAVAAGPTADAVASEPATPSATAIAEILAALPPGALATPGAAPGPAPDVPIDPGVIPPGPDPVDPEAPAAPGVLGTTVGGLENTTGNLGLDLPLGDLTSGLTGPLDKSLRDTLNGVGGALGDKRLGDKLIGSLDNTVNGLVGPGGLTDSLLNP